jgi:hypothetical protein
MIRTPDKIVIYGYIEQSMYPIKCLHALYTEHSEYNPQALVIGTNFDLSRVKVKITIEKDTTNNMTMENAIQLLLEKNKSFKRISERIASWDKDRTLSENAKIAGASFVWAYRFAKNYGLKYKAGVRGVPAKKHKEAICQK